MRGIGIDAMRASRRGRGGVVDLAMGMGGVNALLGWETDTFPYTRMRTGRDTRGWESEYEYE